MLRQQRQELNRSERLFAETSQGRSIGFCIMLRDWNNQVSGYLGRDGGRGVEGPDDGELQGRAESPPQRQRPAKRSQSTRVMASPSPGPFVHLPPPI